MALWRHRYGLTVNIASGNGFSSDGANDDFSSVKSSDICGPFY